MSKKEFLKLLSDPDVHQAIRAIITPEISERQTSELVDAVLSNLNKALQKPSRLSTVGTEGQT